MSDVVVQDERYDTAAMRAYAAALAAFFGELVNSGLDRDEALDLVAELIRTLAQPKADA